MLKQTDLTGFTGTETWWRNKFWPFTYTDGVKHVFQNGGKDGAYWLGDLIASYQNDPRVKDMEFQSWKLKTLLLHQSATITLEDGDNHPILSQSIEYTDFDLRELTLWLIDGVLLLPSEY